MEGRRFRHTAQFRRWRTDRDPESCGYDQLDEPVSYDLTDVLGARPVRRSAATDPPTAGSPDERDLHRRPPGRAGALGRRRRPGAVAARRTRRPRSATTCCCRSRTPRRGSRPRWARSAAGLHDRARALPLDPTTTSRRSARRASGVAAATCAQTLDGAPRRRRHGRRARSSTTTRSRRSRATVAEVDGREAIILTRSARGLGVLPRRLDLARPAQDRRPGAPPARARELRRAGRQRRGRHRPLRQVE